MHLLKISNLQKEYLLSLNFQKLKPCFGYSIHHLSIFSPIIPSSPGNAVSRIHCKCLNWVSTRCQFVSISFHNGPISSCWNQKKCKETSKAKMNAILKNCTFFGFLETVWKVRQTWDFKWVYNVSCASNSFLNCW